MPVPARLGAAQQHAPQHVSAGACVRVRRQAKRPNLESGIGTCFPLPPRARPLLRRRGRHGLRCRAARARPLRRARPRAVAGRHSSSGRVRRAVCAVERRRRRARVRHAAAAARRARGGGFWALRICAARRRSAVCCASTAALRAAPPARAPAGAKPAVGRHSRAARRLRVRCAPAATRSCDSCCHALLRFQTLAQAQLTAPRGAQGAAARLRRAGRAPRRA